jgi:tryptophan synthase alpha chain
MPSNLQTRDRYAAMFQRLQQEQRHALIPFTLLGWPNPKVCLKTIDAFVEGGATALELGLAFSDPMADGPVIQKAATEVLDSGFDVDNALALLATVRERHPDIPIGLLVYYNLVLARGIDAFFKDIAAAGADGVLIADLPVELVDEVLPAAQAHSVHIIGMVSPITDEARLSKILQSAGGFLYVVSRLGITGTEERYAQSLAGLLERIQTQSDLPACVGFGISQPKHVQQMLNLGAQGVIVGSSIIQQVSTLAPDYSTEPLRDYLKSLATIE